MEKEVRERLRGAEGGWETKGSVQVVDPVGTRGQCGVPVSRQHPPHPLSTPNPVTLTLL